MAIFRDVALLLLLILLLCLFYPVAASLFKSSSPLVRSSAPLSVRIAEFNIEHSRSLVLRAFLKMLYISEGTYPNTIGVSPYQVIYSYKSFKDFSDHPRVDIPIPGTDLTSNAAGACQFLSTTYDGVWERYPTLLDRTIPYFDKHNQDLACGILLAELGSYRILMGGVSVSSGSIVVDRKAFDQAVYNACSEWASLPCADGTGIGSSDALGNQRTHSTNTLWKIFQDGLKDEQERYGRQP
jgi:muramidase (phage lysozyme)